MKATYIEPSACTVARVNIKLNISGFKPQILQCLTVNNAISTKKHLNMLVANVGKGVGYIVLFPGPLKDWGQAYRYGQS